jgi:hypothetical protein
VVTMPPASMTDIFMKFVSTDSTFCMFQLGSYDTTVDKFDNPKTGRTSEYGLLRITDDTAAPSGMCAELCSVKNGDERTYFSIQKLSLLSDCVCHMSVRVFSANVLNSVK